MAWWLALSILGAGTAWAQGQPAAEPQSINVRVETLPPPRQIKLPEATFPELSPVSDLRSKEIHVRVIRKDGTVSEPHWAHDMRAFPQERPEVELDVKIPERGGHGQLIPPAGSNWNAESGDLTLKMQQSRLKIPRRDDVIEASIENDAPLVHVGIRCDKRRVRFGASKIGNAVPLFLHFDCKPITLERLEVTVHFPAGQYRPENARGMSGFQVTADSATYQITTKRPVSLTALKVAEFTLRDTSKPDQALKIETVLDAPNRWWFDGSVGMSFLDYSQPYQNLGLTQMGLTAKIGTLFAIKPKKWDLLFSVYSTIFASPIARQPETLPTTLFLGTNIRIGYHLPRDSFSLFNWKYRIYGGWYSWSMLGQTTYGLRLLTGPQLFLFAEHEPWKNGNTSFTYMKLGLLAEGLSTLSFDNGEVAVGGGYAFPMFGRQWTASLDIARASLMSADHTKLLQLLSVSTGLQMNFHF